MNRTKFSDVSKRVLVSARLNVDEKSILVASLNSDCEISYLGSEWVQQLDLNAAMREMHRIAGYLGVEVEYKKGGPKAMPMPKGIFQAVWDGACSCDVRSVVDTLCPGNDVMYWEVGDDGVRTGRTISAEITHVMSVNKEQVVMSFAVFNKRYS